MPEPAMNVPHKPVPLHSESPLHEEPVIVSLSTETNSLGDAKTKSVSVSTTSDVEELALPVYEMKGKGEYPPAMKPKVIGDNYSIVVFLILLPAFQAINTGSDEAITPPSPLLDEATPESTPEPSPEPQEPILQQGTEEETEEVTCYCNSSSWFAVYHGILLCLFRRKFRVRGRKSRKIRKTTSRRKLRWCVSCWAAS